MFSFYKLIFVLISRPATNHYYYPVAEIQQACTPPCSSSL